MAKRKFNLEYSLNAVSGPILWNAIGTPTGLQTWMSDNVDANENIYTFEWSQNEIRQAELIHRRVNSHMRFHWLDDEEKRSYFELRVNYNELTEDMMLEVTDWAEPDEADDLRDLWDSEIEKMKRVSGL